MNLAAAVLAGGASRRMGSTKALVEVDGTMMGERVLDTARSAGADPVVLYGGDPDELAALSADVVTELFPGEGPLGGVVGALEHFAAVSDRVLILSCDLAFLDLDTLLALRSAEAGDSVSQAWVAATDRLEPTCAIWSTRALPTLRPLFEAGERALHAGVRALPHVAITVDEAALSNINTPDDVPG